MSKPEWKLIVRGDVLKYKCGLQVEDRLRIITPIVITDHKGIPTGRIHDVGEVWTVVPGARDDPVLFLRQADGELHVWHDDERVFETFERIEDA